MNQPLFTFPFKAVRRDVWEGPNISVQVLSRHCIENGRGTHEEPYAFISITEPQNYHVKPPECPHRHGYLPLHFHDVPHDVENRGKEYVTITEDQAAELARFVSAQLSEGVRLFVVNCEVGISRSAAVGAALWAHFNGDASAFFDNYCPNKTVYERVRAALKEPQPAELEDDLPEDFGKIKLSVTEKALAFWGDKIPTAEDCLPEELIEPEGEGEQDDPR